MPKASDDYYVDSGYRVIGPNTFDYSTHCWYFPTEAQARQFAEQLARDVQDNVIVCKYLGRYRPALPPVEFKSATDLAKENKDAE